MTIAIIHLSVAAVPPMVDFIAALTWFAAGIALAEGYNLICAVLRGRGAKGRSRRRPEMVATLARKADNSEGGVDSQARPTRMTSWGHHDMRSGGWGR